MFKAINAGSRQFRGPPGFPPEAEPTRHLDIVWTRSMQFDDLALIVRLQDAYCMDRSKVSRELSHDTQRERLRAFETTWVNRQTFLQSEAHTFAAPQLRRGLGRTSRKSDATSTIAERPLHYISSCSLLVR
jgi:hypothetical protein